MKNELALGEPWSKKNKQKCAICNANHSLVVKQMSPFSLPSLKQKVESQNGYLIHALAIYMLGPSQRSAYI
jgi:hypothetical protein